MIGEELVFEILKLLRDARFTFDSLARIVRVLNLFCRFALVDGPLGLFNLTFLLLFLLFFVERKTAAALGRIGLRGVILGPVLVPGAAGNLSLLLFS